MKLLLEVAMEETSTALEGMIGTMDGRYWLAKNIL
jgi:hypothetical protein